ncbi:MAG TPA: pilus assembly protein PilM [Bacillota bacterium]|nr:pilus assembly protein PilM [Bacillota bacterium]HQC35728.1 pilus assembly protein PilM [Bacillota bacterium]
MAKSMVGFDIGVSELKAAIWDGRRVKRIITAPTPENLVKDGIIVSYEAMADFIKESLKRSHAPGLCAVILPSNYVFIRRFNMQNMTKAQLEVNLPYEFKDFLTQSKDRYFFDYAVNNVVEEEDGTYLDLLAACVGKDVISDYRNMFRRAGFKLAVAVPAEAAYLDIIRAQPHIEDVNFCFADFGCSATRLVIFNGAGYEVSRNMDIGVRTMCEAIAKYYGVDEPMARGYLLENRENCQELPELQSIYNTIAVEIRKAVSFYAFSSGKGAVEDLWCCGGGSHIDAFMRTVEEGTGLRLKPVTQLLPPVPDNSNPMSAAAAIGAVMQGG